MRRRALLGTLASGAAVGVSGCLGGDPVVDMQESTRIEAHRSWVQEISGVDGSASLSYDVRSEDDRFWVFYFTDESEFEYYQQQVMSDDDTGQATGDLNEPDGKQELSNIATQADSGVYQAAVPDGDGRHSMNIEGTHYFVVDYSNYGMGVQVPDSADPLQVSISLEVVDDYF